MNDIRQRNYYKLFTGTNESNGHNKIHLGYTSSVSEIVFKKDKGTLFHIPFFTTSQNVSSGELAGAGAVPGPIPAMADRICKKQGNYGNTTPWGTTTDVPNGTWLCSWLYSLSGESPIWLDRFYNPGKITYGNALLGEPDYESYTNNDPVFEDVPSSIILEPGVLYEYYHCGEKTAQQIVETFAGPELSSLKLDIQTWSETPTDESIYKNSSLITNFKPEWGPDLKETDVINRNILNFKNTDFIDARVSYSSVYNSENEFTINFWVQNDNWNTATGSQLIGNLNYGGYSISYNNLKYYPFFAIPETFYGHLYYFNQEGFNYLDKSTQPIIPELTATSLSSPRQININSEHEVLVLDVGGANSFYKMNHLGDVLAVPRLSSGELFITKGQPKQFIINKDDSCLFQTTTELYLFDSNLTFIGLSSIPYVDNTNFSVSDIIYNYNIVTKIQPGTYTILPSAINTNGVGTNIILQVEVNNLSAIESVNIVDGGENVYLNDILNIDNTVFVNTTGLVSLTLTATTVDFGGRFVYNLDGDLVTEGPCTDVKYDNTNQKWIIDNNGNLLCNNLPLTGIQNCTNIAIDPTNNIWVLSESNNITKIEPQNKTLIQTFKIGSPDNNESKNISFIYTYDRINNEQIWYSLIYHNKDKTLYQVTLDGKIKYTTFIPDKTNINLSPPSLQDKAQMKFDSQGDFTGYEWKRIFNKVLYNNNPQLQFKIAAQKPLRGTPINIFKVSVPVQYLTNSTWHLITGVYKNRTLSLYIDTRLRDKIVLPGNYNISYLRKNDLYIGTPTGKLDNLNYEVNSKALIFNGYIDNIKIYDYAINPFFLNMFVRSKFVAQDIFWSVPTTPIQYIETIDRFFKHKAPGSKSIFFNIKIAGLDVVDIGTKEKIEEFIKTSVEQIKPAHSELLDIEWV
jgi:hypothetical protein